MIRSPRSSIPAHVGLGVAGLSRHRRRSSAGRAPGRRRGAGPRASPTADESAAPQSAPVEATMRAAKVEAFNPCSAAADPVRVDRLHGPRVGLAAPLEQEPLGRCLALCDDVGRARRPCGRRRRGPSARRCPSSARTDGRGPRAPVRPRSRSASELPHAAERAAPA